MAQIKDFLKNNFYMIKCIFMLVKEKPGTSIEAFVISWKKSQEIDDPRGRNRCRCKKDGNNGKIINKNDISVMKIATGWSFFFVSGFWPWPLLWCHLPDLLVGLLGSATGAKTSWRRRRQINFYKQSPPVAFSSPDWPKYSSSIGWGFYDQLDGRRQRQHLTGLSEWDDLNSDFLIGDPHSSLLTGNCLSLANFREPQPSRRTHSAIVDEELWDNSLSWFFVTIRFYARRRTRRGQ